MMTLKINKWDGFRIALIAVAISGVAVVLSNEFLSNKNESKAAINIKFPETIPLPNWQAISSSDLTAKNEDQSDLGRLYQYHNGQEKLKIDARYQLYTDSNASRLLMVYEGIPPATILPKTKYIKDLGHYYLFDYKDQAYLSACLPPKGETSVTQQQYVNNRYRYGWSIPRSFFWLIGQQDLFESRCLWTVVSMPVDTYASADATDKAFEQLEKAWFAWFDWWQKNPFP